MMAATIEPPLLLGMVAFFASYLAVILLSLPRLYFLPLEGRLRFASHVAGCAMGYAGLCMSSAVTGGLAFLVATLLRLRVSARVHAFLSVLAGVAFIASLSTFVWLEWPWPS